MLSLLCSFTHFIASWATRKIVAIFICDGHSVKHTTPTLTKATIECAISKILFIKKSIALSLYFGSALLIHSLYTKPTYTRHIISGNATARPFSNSERILTPFLAYISTTNLWRSCAVIQLILFTNLLGA